MLRITDFPSTLIGGFPCYVPGTHVDDPAPLIEAETRMMQQDDPELEAGQELVASRDIPRQRAKDGGVFHHDRVYVAITDDCRFLAAVYHVEQSVHLVLTSKIFISRPLIDDLSRSQLPILTKIVVTIGHDLFKIPPLVQFILGFDASPHEGSPVTERILVQAQFWLAVMRGRNDDLLSIDDEIPLPK